MKTTIVLKNDKFFLSSNSFTEDIPVVIALKVAAGVLGYDELGQAAVQRRLGLELGLGLPVQVPLGSPCRGEHNPHLNLP